MRTRCWVSRWSSGMCLVGLAGLTLTGCGSTELRYRIGFPQGFQTEWRSPAEPIPVGQRIRFELTSAQDSYVYVLEKGSGGLYSIWVPNRDLGQTRNFIPAGQTLELPAAGPGLAAASDRGFLPTRGVIAEIVLVCSRTPVADLERLYLSADRSVSTVEPLLRKLEPAVEPLVSTDPATRVTTVRLVGSGGPIVHRCTLRLSSPGAATQSTAGR